MVQWKIRHVEWKRWLIIIACATWLSPVVARANEIVAGPYLLFDRQDRVVVSWETAEPCIPTIEYGEGEQLNHRIHLNHAETSHSVALEGLRTETSYQFRISCEDGSLPRDVFTIDSTFGVPETVIPDDLAPFPADEWTPHYERLARQIIAETGIDKGYGLVLGFGTGRLAFELAKQSRLNVIGIEDDESHIQKARAILHQAGVYGARISVLEGSLDRLPFNDYFANLIVSDVMALEGTLMGNTDEIARVLRPWGGVAYLGRFHKSGASFTAEQLTNWLKERPGYTYDVRSSEGVWAKLTRGPLEGAGEWTHMYADPGNTACSGDTLVKTPTRLQWFGQPGPRLMVDRHHRPIIPLWKNGRLIIPGNDRVMAVDAYNGTRLWDVGVPESRRIAIVKDCSNLMALDDAVYVAYRNHCVVLDGATGHAEQTVHVPQTIENEVNHWGYIVGWNGVIIGSAQKPGASRSELSRDSVVELYGDLKPLVTSRYLFALNRTSGNTLWSHRSGTIFNSAIAIGDGYLFWIETRMTEADLDVDGRIRLDTINQNPVYLVALDIQTGTVAWERAISIKDCAHVLFLSYANSRLLVTGTRNGLKYVEYTLAVYDADEGRLVWTQKHNHTKEGIGGDHGEQEHHPVIAGNTIFSEPYAFDLQTGNRINPQGGSTAWAMPSRGGCGTISGSAGCLFFRDGNPAAIDMRIKAGVQKLTQVSRVGCWINMIPAGGLILIPEASSGCTCSYAIQTSLALIPSP